MTMRRTGRHLHAPHRATRSTGRVKDAVRIAKPGSTLITRFVARLHVLQRDFARGIVRLPGGRRVGLCHVRIHAPLLRARTQRVRAVLATSVGLLVVLLVISCPAWAARGHVFGFEFAGPGSASGQLNGPAGLAVDEATGNVYVVDRGNDRVEVFNAAGTKVEGEFNGSGKLPGEGKEAGTGGRPGEIKTGQFDRPAGIAVDNACHSKEAETHHALSKAECEALDRSNGDVYVITGAQGLSSRVIDKFSATGEYLGQITRTPETREFPGSGGINFLDISGVAVDQRGTLWVAEEHDDAENVGVDGTDSFSNDIENVWHDFRVTRAFPFSNGFGLAVDSKDDLYLRNNAGAEGSVAEFDSTGTLLNRAVGGESLTAVAWNGIAAEANTDDVYISSVGSVSRFSRAGGLIERFGEAQLSGGSAELSGGMAVDSSSGVVYVADAAKNVIDAFPLEPPAAPRIESESVSDVTATGVTLGAEINPRSEPGEPPTSYRIEYGLCGTLAQCKDSPYASSVPVPEGELPPDFEVHSVSQHVAGLQPHAAYHFHVLATNSRPGAAEGPERMFTTQSAGTFALPDGRAWEMVSPADKHGALLQPITEQGLTQAAASGNAIAYLASAPTEAEPQGNSNFVQVFSARGPTGWASRDIAAPHTEATGLSLGLGEEYSFFSSDLSLGVLQPVGSFNPELSPAASEQTAYLRRNYPAGHVDEPCSPLTMSCYSPLTTGCPPAGEACNGTVAEHANVPPGTVFGVDQLTGQECPPHPKCGPEFVGASADLAHAVLQSRVPLAEPHTNAREALYEWAAGEDLKLVSVLPDHEPASGRAHLGSENGGREQVARHAVSEDGSRVVWSEVIPHPETPGEEHLYLRDMTRGQTVLLDAVHGGTAEGPAEPAFQIASSDGSKVFFTDQQHLTPDAGAQSERPDLYECELLETAGELECRLTDLTPSHGGEAADVQGTVLGASEDGSFQYFVANGVLAPGAAPRDCHGARGSAFEGTCNLYVRHDGTTSLIAVLSGKDFPDFASGNQLSGLTARVSPDGHWLAFMSQLPLTGYDNRDAASGHRDQEVYLFDASRPASEGHPDVPDNPTCVSCNPTGARPHGIEYSHLNNQAVGGDRVWESATWLAANVPGWTPYRLGAALYQSRYLSDSGRLFFNSSDALSPLDTNGNEDVYEYEPAGVGSCSEARATFSEASGGCIDTISSGTSTGESAFLDASESGDDVFFLTAGKLAPQDFDTSLDIYDAHVCSAAGPCPPPPPPPAPACNGDACQSPGTAPEDPTPGSLTYQGPGNISPPVAASKPKSAGQLKAEKLANALKRCRKDKAKRKRARCEKQARKRFGAPRANHGHHRRGK
jgi:DNA-binding beta-propeller fold protein YncE